MNDSITIKLNESQSSEEANSYSNNNDTEECRRSLSSIGNYGTLLYGRRQKPTVILSLVLAIQIVAVVTINTIWLPLVVSPSLCIHPDDPARIEIISLSMFLSGISTLFFSTIGLRLPVLLLPNIYYINSMIKLLLNTPELKCPGAGDLYAMGHESRTLEWQNRVNALQGGILTISIIQCIFGITGISGLFDRILSNILVLIPTTIMIGLSFFTQTMNLLSLSEFSKETNITMEWGTAVLTIGILVTVGLKLQNLEFTVPSYTHKNGFSTNYLKLFRLFPVIFTSFFVLVIYPFISILINGRKTAEKVLLEQSFENSEGKFLKHLPFSYGWPSFSLDVVLPLLPAATIQMIQSILIYHVTNFIHGESIERKCINKGTTIEGVASFIAGTFGMSTASSPINLGLMQLTGVGSRSVVQLSGILLMLFSMSPSSLQFLVGIQPVFILSTLFIISALISVTGLSMMRKINMSSIRNCTVIGLSLNATIVIQNFVQDLNSESNVIQLFIELFSSSIVICVIFTTILDYILPERSKSHIHDTSETKGKKEKKGLSFCEELLAVCF